MSVFRTSLNVDQKSLVTSYLDARAKCGYSRLNNGRFIQLWLTGPVLRTFMQYLMAFCSRQETASDVVSGRFVGPFVHDQQVNFVILAKTVLEKFHPKPSDAAFTTVF